MADDEEIEEMVGNISVKQCKILAAIDSNDGVANTHDITNATSLANQDVGYHTKRNLIPAGLVEQVGSEETEKGGNPANKYRLTDLGEEVVFEVRREKPTPHRDEINEERIKSIEQDMDRLFRLVGEIEETSSTNRDALVELRDRVEALGDAMGGVHDRIESLRNQSPKRCDR